MGANRQLVTKIFLFEGWLVSLGGVVVGLFIGIILVLLQEKFGFVGFAGSEEYIINAYPVELRWTDAAIVLITVATVGVVAAWYPVKTIVKKYYNNTDN